MIMEIKKSVGRECRANRFGPLDLRVLAVRTVWPWLDC